MYKGYKSYRHYLNAKLHALSYLISGDESVIESELFIRGLNSVKQLSDKDASIIYRTLKEIAKNLGKGENELKTTTGDKRASENQKRAILKLARHTFNWSDEAICSYIFDMYPDKRKKMNEWEIKKADVYKLLNILTTKEANKVIKRLDKIKERNARLKN